MELSGNFGPTQMWQPRKKFEYGWIWNILFLFKNDVFSLYCPPYLLDVVNFVSIADERRMSKKIRIGFLQEKLSPEGKF